MALALVPEEFVPSLFAHLTDEVNDYEHDELGGVFRYFNDYWMSRIKLWNVFKISDRTNNFSEGMNKNTNLLSYSKNVILIGYNNRFTTRLSKKHPNIWVFINAIQKEAQTVHQLICQINSGMTLRTKRPKSKIADQRMKELYERFDKKHIDPQELLKQLSFLSLVESE